MPLELKDFAKALDLDLKKYDEAPEPLKAFVEDFGKEWKRAKDVPDIDAYKGKLNNIFRGGIKKVSKEYELDIDLKDDADPVDYLPEIAKRIQGKSAAQLAELQKKLESNVPDKALKEWEEKYGKLEQKYKDVDLNMQATAKRYQDLEKSVAEKEAAAWSDGQWKEAEGKIEWRQDVSDYEKKGFLSEQRTRFKPQKDEKGEVYTSDANGNRIPDPAKPAKFKSLDELLIESAKAAKLWKVHEKGGQRVNNVVLRTNEVPGGPPMQKPAHRLHPSLQQ